MDISFKLILKSGAWYVLQWIKKNKKWIRYRGNWYFFHEKTAACDVIALNKRSMAAKKGWLTRRENGRTSVY